MPWPLSIGASRAYCVTIEDGVVRYRLTDARHEPERDRAGDSSVGVGRDECAANGVDVDGADVVAELDRAARRREVAPWVPLAAVFVVYIATVGALGVRLSTAGVVATFVLVLAASAAVYVVCRRVDRERGTVRLAYHLDAAAAAKFARLRAALRRLAACHRVWHVPAEGHGSVGHQRYGAKLYLRRYRIRPELSGPARVLSNLRVPTLYGEHRRYYFYPERVLVFDERGVRTLGYGGLGLRTAEVLCVEDEDVPFDARVVETTWLHVRPDGSPDPAIANNRRYPIVLYGELELVGPGGVRERFHVSQPDAAADLVAAIEALGTHAESEIPDDEEDEADAEPSDDADAEADDERFDDALRVVVRTGDASLDVLVRELGVSFGKAAALVARMEADGYVGPAIRHRPRVVLRSAVRYVELVFGRDAAEDARRRAERAKARRKRGQSRRSNGTSRWSPAEVLGVDANASTEEITAAYRELATQYHPDKVASLADEFRELAERRMKEINAAYRALTHRS